MGLCCSAVGLQSFAMGPRLGAVGPSCRAVLWGYSGGAGGGRLWDCDVGPCRGAAPQTGPGGAMTQLGPGLPPPCSPPPLLLLLLLRDTGQGE